MKRLILILFLIVVNCKNETENGIDSTVYDMWANFTKSNPEFKKEKLPDSYYFHDNETDANRLLTKKRKQVLVYILDIK